MPKPCISWNKVQNHIKKKKKWYIHKEVDIKDGNGAGSTPHETSLIAEITRISVDEVGIDLSEDVVPQPVGSGSERHGLATDVEGEELTDEDPGGGTPGGGETEDVNESEHDQASTSGLRARSSGTDDGDNVLRDNHNDTAVDEQLATAETIHSNKTGEGRERVDDVGEGLNEEGIGKVGGFEEGSTVVEDKVNTSKLLEHLDEDTDQGTFLK